MSKPAPGTLTDDEQVRFNAQIISLIRATYGEDAHYALIVFKKIDEIPTDPGIGMWVSGSMKEAKVMQAAFTMATKVSQHARMRMTEVDDEGGHA